MRRSVRPGPVGSVFWLIVGWIVVACTSVGSTASTEDRPGPEHIAALGQCGEAVMSAEGGVDGLDEAFGVCGSVEEFAAATALRPGLFTDPVAAVEFAFARCTMEDGLESSLLCHSDSLIPKTPPPRVDDVPKVAIDQDYLKYLDELAAAEERAKRQARRAREQAAQEAARVERERKAAERERQAAQKERAATQLARRAISRYEAKARSTYARVLDAVDDMYAANVAVEGLTREERQATHQLMDRYRLPAVRALNAHLAFMRANPASTCPSDLHRVDRELAQRWRGLLVKGNYPSTLSGGGRSAKIEFDAALKRTNTFLRNLDKRVTRCE